MTQHEHEHGHGHGHGHGAAEPARPEPAPPAWEPCCRPTGYERRLGAILLEVYQPWLLLAVKLPPVAVLRIGKTIALVFTEGVGRAVCCWGAGESRLLDAVGLGTAALCRSIYGEEIDQAFVRAFLARRFLFCTLTTAATTIQIIMQLAGVPQYSVVLSFLLAPVTLIDRQLATLVTKMSPRYDRAQLEHLLFYLTASLRGSPAKPGPFPDIPAPQHIRAAGATNPCASACLPSSPRHTENRAQECRAGAAGCST